MRRSQVNTIYLFFFFGLGCGGFPSLEHTVSSQPINQFSTKIYQPRSQKMKVAYDYNFCKERANVVERGEGEALKREMAHWLCITANQRQYTFEQYYNLKLMNLGFFEKIGAQARWGEEARK